MNRRRFLQGSALGLGWLATARLWAATAAQGKGAAMEPWRPGLLDIHHISTGLGNSVLAICPDGTSILIDAGAKTAGADTAAAVPNGSLRPGQWIGRYAQRHLKPTPKQEIDYFLLTHLHDDHVGYCGPETPLAPSGEYRLTGISDVAEILPVRRLVDRGWPAYSYPEPHTDATALNYIAFAKACARRGAVVERAAVGSARQVVLQHAPGEYGAFSVRSLAADGRVWRGTGEAVQELFPAVKTLAQKDYPTENMCSAAWQIGYGSFRYYNGGDLTCDTAFGTEPWRDVETPVARAAGPVSVAALNHHGYYDADGPDFVRAMRARVWVEQSWHASHPALATLDRLYSPVLYAGARDVLATSLVPAAELADARLSDKMLSQQGHVVVRVAEVGASYEVIVLDDSVEEGKIKGRFGPFLS